VSGAEFSWSPYKRQAMERVRRVTTRRAQVRFASPEDVIVHKIIAGRPRDLEDVRLILLKNPKLDREYVLNWLTQFEQALGEEFSTRWREVSREA
jgi:hypothetical protein